MFKALYGKSLGEETFDSWLEKGRSSNLGYHYLLVIWNTFDEEYQPAFVSTRDDLADYKSHLSMEEILVAIYDLYSESRITQDT